MERNTKRIGQQYGQKGQPKKLHQQIAVGRARANQFRMRQEQKMIDT